MGASVLLLGYGGIVVHLLHMGHLEYYQSVWSWAGAIGINSFGLVLNLAAGFGHIETGKHSAACLFVQFHDIRILCQITETRIITGAWKPGIAFVTGLSE